MRKLLPIILIVAVFAVLFATVFPQAIATLPDGTEISVATNDTINADLLNKVFKTGSFLIMKFKAGPSKWDLWAWVLVVLGVLFILQTFMIIGILISPTKVDDEWLKGKYFPFVLKWVSPLTSFILKFNSKK